MNIFESISKLPSEIQDVIMSSYWRDVFDNNILPHLESPQKLDIKINKFFDTYCLNPGRAFFNDAYLHYLKQLNLEIYTLVQNKSMKTICKNINSCLYYCYDPAKFITNNIHKDLQLICCYAINTCLYHRYNIYKRFQSLSILS